MLQPSQNVERKFYIILPFKNKYPDVITKNILILREKKYDSEEGIRRGRWKGENEPTNVQNEKLNAIDRNRFSPMDDENYVKRSEASKSAQSAANEFCQYHQILI